MSIGPRRPMIVSSAWVQGMLLTFVIGFAILGYLALRVGTRPTRRDVAAARHTPARRYLDQPEPVYLDCQGRPRKASPSGSCYHDLALSVCMGVWRWIGSNEPAETLLRYLRFHTAAGDEVEQYLCTIKAQVACECRQAVERQKLERGKVKEVPTKTMGADPGQALPQTPNVTEDWTVADGPQQWAKVFGVSSTTFKRLCQDGKIRHKKLSAKSYMVASNSTARSPVPVRPGGVIDRAFCALYRQPLGPIARALIPIPGHFP